MTSKVLWKGTLLADGKVVDAADLHASQRLFIRTNEYPIFAVRCIEATGIGATKPAKQMTPLYQIRFSTG
jgi:hypothetical protein